ncbi:uncharacterized protein LOC118174326 [Oxyura jamaicensis]|uniref:uncharacterized protein LOC118174326 n=1 Tax=Oxyura jamaicensis TaxID=8884 RepID=UPI0015A69D53|nr:uncharacterized protein LOC118174326 [Oxyura jamaicensis]
MRGRGARDPSSVQLAGKEAEIYLGACWCEQKQVFGSTLVSWSSISLTGPLQTMELMRHSVASPGHHPTPPPAARPAAWTSDPSSTGTAACSDGECDSNIFCSTCPCFVPLLAAFLTRVTSSSVHSAKEMFLPGTLKAKKPHHLAVVRRRKDSVLQPQADALVPPNVFLGDRSLAIKRYCGAALLRINLSPVSNQSVEDINLQSTSGLTAARLCNT